jgi:hypothetical protein
MLLLALCSFIFQFSFAQDADEEGCKDHPFFTRLPKFRISSCVSNYNAVPVRLAETKAEDVEGNVTKINYSFNPATEQDKPPSPLQVIRNYENAIVKNGGKKVLAAREITGAHLSA